MTRFVAHSRHGCVETHDLIVVARQAEVRSIDRHAIETVGISGQILMENAGFAAARRLMARFGDEPGRALVLCGPGNNGGDGYVIARHLKDHGWSVDVVATAPPKAGTDAAANAALWSIVGGSTHHGSDLLPSGFDRFDIIIDAMFGTGFDRPSDIAVTALIDAANASNSFRVAIDLPTGLDGDLGRTFGPVFKANLTFTFGLLKTGLLTGRGPDVAGEIIVLPIGWPMISIETVSPSCRRPTPGWIARFLPRREPGGHKGTSGHVAIIGGCAGKEGAARLAALGAFRGGAGLCTWVRRAPPTERMAELMAEDPFSNNDTAMLPTRPDVLIIGPGLGHDIDANALVAAARKDPRPRVFDADALSSTFLDHPLHCPENCVITPHPLEAARILGMTVADIEADRISAAQMISARSGSVCILKGRNPVVTGPGQPPFILDITAPALATGGTGDVLAGLVAALIAQGLSAFVAAIVATEVHGRAGREAGHAQADRGVLASEIADHVPAMVASLLAGFAI